MSPARLCLVKYFNIIFSLPCMGLKKNCVCFSYQTNQKQSQKKQQINKVNLFIMLLVYPIILPMWDIYLILDKYL